MRVALLFVCLLLALASGAEVLSASDPQLATTSPTRNQQDVSLLPALTWSGAAGATFELFFGKAADSLDSRGSQTSPFTPPAPLDAGTPYFWRVDSTIGGKTIQGGAYSFTTRTGIEVTTAVDENDGLGVGGVSLRDAITEAVPGETITFNSALSGQRIVLTNGQLVIDKTLTIDASALANGITIDANGANTEHRVFEIMAGKTVAIIGLTLSHGIADFGGAIRNNATLSLKNSTISDSSASSNGGGIYNYFGALTVENVTLAGNTAQSGGGGIWSAGGSFSLTNSTVVGNSAPSHAGIANENGNATLIHSTIYGNIAAKSGGGYSHLHNKATLTIENTIIAGNKAPKDPDFYKEVGTITPTGANLIGDNGTVSKAFPLGALVGNAANPVDPQLAPLGDYGGPTQTMPLLVGSPAIDAGVATSLTTDQRGFPRVLDGSTPGGGGTAVPDIGAWEAGEVTLVSDTSDNSASSLRQALAIATDPGDRILFNLPSSSEIRLTGGELSLSGNRTIFLDASKLVDASGNVAVEEGGVTVSGDNKSRVFDISAESIVAIHSLTVSDGIYSGIVNRGTLTLTASTISNNSASFGGAIRNAGGSVILKNSTVSGNSADGAAGGILISGGTLLMEASTVANNQAGIRSGGGVWLELDAVGTIRHSTVAANKAGTTSGTELGAGIMNISAVPLTLENTIVADNIAEARLGGSNARSDIAGDFTAVGANLVVGHSSGTVTGPAPITADPALAPLADNGGPTMTMMLSAGSPAIDKGVESSATPFTDQRGFTRILAGGLDIGAYETGAGNFNLNSLTVYARIDPALTDSGVEFQISTDRNFLPTVSTLAGTESVESKDGPRATAQFSYVSGVAQDAAGNLHIADTGNHRIRKMSPAGEVSTIAGTGRFGFADGSGNSATFAFPVAVAVGPDGALYVADTFNHSIRKLTRPAIAGLQWTVTTLAGDGISGFVDGAGSVARFSHPQGLALDPQGNVYVADSLNHRIRQVTPAGAVSTFAGSETADFLDGAKATAKFNFPSSLAFDSAGNLFVADRDNQRIREIDKSNGMVSTLAGELVGLADGTGPSARFSGPVALAVDDEDNLYVSDAYNQRIRKVTPGGVVTTVAGTETAGFQDGAANEAKFDHPSGLLVDNREKFKGDLIVADTRNHRLRRIVVNPITVPATIDAGGENASWVPVSASIDAVALGLDSNMTQYFRWRSANGRTQMLGQSFFLVDPPTVVTEAASNLTSTAAWLTATVDPKGSTTNVVFEYSTDPNLAGPRLVSTLAAGNHMSNPRGVALDAAGNVNVAEHDGHAILVFDSDGQPAGRYGSNVAGFADGPSTAARFDHPAGVAFDSTNNLLYVADEFNHRIRKIDLSTGMVSTFAGSGVAGFADGAADSARYLFPTGVAVDANHNVYVADTGNHRIRKITPTGEVTTIAGTGLPGFADGAAGTAQFDSPLAVAVNAAGNVYVADTGNHRIRVITAGNDVITIAGTGTEDFLDGPGTGAEFASPAGIAVDGDDTAYVTDRDNHRIRRIASDGQVSTVAGSGVAGSLNSPEGALHPATAAEFNRPAGITVDGAGNLFVTQGGNAALRKIARDTLPEVPVTPDSVGVGNRQVSTDIPQPLLPGATYYFRAVATNGRGRAEGEILSFVTPQPEIVVHNGGSTAASLLSPGQKIDFGATPFDTPVERTFTIQNIGDYELEISGVAMAGPSSDAFTLSWNTGASTVPAGGSTTFSLTLEEDSAGSFADRVIITSNDPGEKTIEFSVSGEVLAPPALRDVTASDVTATGVTFSATVETMGSATEVAFEYSKYQDFESTLEVLPSAGSDQGFANGCGAGAKFDSPSGVAVDGFGNIYVADTKNHRIRKVTPNGDCGVLAGTGVAGFADGAGTVAQFDSPAGVAVDASGNVYVADTRNHRIRRVTPDGDVTTVAGFGGAGAGAFTDGVGSAARFKHPTGVAIDSTGNIYVADSGNNRIRKIGATGEVSTFAGPAEFKSPKGVAVDVKGNVFVADSDNNRIRKITPGGMVSTLPGEGTFNGPTGVAVDTSGNVYVADRDGHRIVRIDTDAVDQIITLAGTLNDPGGNDGTGMEAKFDLPTGVAVSASGTIYVADYNNHRVRQINPVARRVVAATNLNSTGPIPVKFDVTGLEPNTTYYYRGIATNGGGTVNSPMAASFITLQVSTEE